MTELAAAESAASALSRGARRPRAASRRERREAHDAARAAATGDPAARRAARRRSSRRSSAIGAASLDERAAAEAELTAGRRALAAPVPARDLDLEAALGEAERELADALAELGALRTATPGPGRGAGRAPPGSGGPPGRARDRAPSPRRGRAPSGRGSRAGGGGHRTASGARDRARRRCATELTAAIEAERGAATRRETRPRASERDRGRARRRPRACRRGERVGGVRARASSTRSRRDWPRRRRAGSLGRLAGPGVAGSTRISSSIRRCEPPPRPPWPRRRAPTSSAADAVRDARRRAWLARGRGAGGRCRDPRTPASAGSARPSRRPVAGRSTTRSGATRPASPGDSSPAPRGSRTWRPASPSRPTCRRAGSW